MKFNNNGKDYLITLIETREHLNNAEQWVKERGKQQNDFILWIQKSENATGPGLSATTQGQSHSQACLKSNEQNRLTQTGLHREVSSVVILSTLVSSKIKLTWEKIVSEHTAPGLEGPGFVSPATALVHLKVLCFLSFQTLPCNIKEGN